MDACRNPGGILIALGAIAVSISAAVTLVSMVFLGWFLVIGGIAHGIHAFSYERRRILTHLLFATLYVVVGIMVITNPVAAEMGVTLLLTAFFLIAGIFRIVASVTVPFSNRLSVLVSGIIAFLLGIFLWAGWPATGFWVIGLFIGIEMIFNGWSLVMLGIATRHATGEEIPHAP